ncbi:hypothetical protein D3C80_1223930 [compost metagenome]
MVFIEQHEVDLASRKSDAFQSAPVHARRQSCDGLLHQDWFEIVGDQRAEPIIYRLAHPLLRLHGEPAAVGEAEHCVAPRQIGLDEGWRKQQRPIEPGEGREEAVSARRVGGGLPIVEAKGIDHRVHLRGRDAGG